MSTTTDKVQMFIHKMQNSNFLQSMMAGMMASMPATITGAFATLLNSISIPAYQTFLQNTGISELLGIAVQCTTNIIALLVVMGMAGAYAERKDVANTRGASLLALVAFLMLTPLGSVTDDYGHIKTNIPMDYLGSGGMFSAIIVGAVVAALYAYIERKHWTIKMPESVPSMVSEGFEAMIPGIIIGTIFLAVRAIFAATPFGNLHAFVYGILQVPLSGLAGNIWSMVVVAIVTGVLWFFGIHGGMVTLGVIAPILMTLDYENMAAVAAGAAPTNAVCWAFNNLATLAGGYIGLQLCLTLFAKSERYRTLGKVSLVPALCCISEPLIFGTPLVMNVDLAIPFIFSQVATLLVGYLGMQVGLLPILPGISAPTGTPFVLRGFIAGGLPWAIFELLMIALCTIIYLPFFKRVDAKALAEEQATAEEA